MKHLLNSGLLKIFLLVVALAAVGRASAGENRIYIPDFTINSYEPTTVEVMLDNEDPIQGFQFDVKLPEGLSIVQSAQSPALTTRCSGTHRVNFNPDNGRMIISTFSGAVVNGNEGAVVTFQVKPAQGMLDTDRDETLELTGIVMTWKNEEGERESFYQDPEYTTIQIGAGYINPVFDVTVASQELNVKPGNSYKVGVNLSNNVDVNAFQLDIAGLPEGFTVDQASFARGDHGLSGMLLIPTYQSSGTIRVLIFDDMTNVIANPGEGELFSFAVTVPEDFAAENASFALNEIQLSAYTSQSFECAPIEIKVNNLKATYEAAIATIAPLREKLAAALETIATEAPNVKDDFTGAEIAAQIDAMEADIEEAYENGTILADYNELVAPATEIAQAIETLVADAVAAEKKFHEDGAKANADAKIAELKAAYDKALETIAIEAPDVKDEYLGAAINEQIVALEVAVEEAYAAGTLAANYDEVMAPAAAIAEAIDQLVADAIAAQKAFVENGAKATADAKIAELKAALEAARETIAAEAADVKDEFTGAEIEEQIAALEAAVEEAYEAGTLATDYNEIMAPAAAIAEAIDQLVADAVAAEKKYKEDAAKADADAEIAQLRADLANALAVIAEECPNVKDEFNGTEISQKIAALEGAVNMAWAIGQLADNYNEIMAPAAEIRGAIEQLVADARVAEEMFNENLRQEANLAAYNEDLAKIAVLQVKLEEALSYIEENYPSYDAVAQEAEEILMAINVALENAESEFSNVEFEGTYVPQVTDEVEANIIAMIDQMLYNAEHSSGIDQLIMKAERGEVMIFTLDGRKVSRPVQGQVNVFVDRAGNTTKQYVR